jgi:hypothetical protein
MIGMNNPPQISNNNKPIASIIVTTPTGSEPVGNVGIGTNAPTTRLHVNGGFRLENGTQAAGRILTSDAAGNASWQIAPPDGWSLTGNSTAPSTTTTGPFLGTTNAEPLRIRTNNFERMQINNDGYIGISGSPSFNHTLLSFAKGTNSGESAIRGVASLIGEAAGGSFEGAIGVIAEGSTWGLRAFAKPAVGTTILNPAAISASSIFGTASNTGVFTEAKGATGDNIALDGRADGSAGRSYGVRGLVANPTNPPSEPRYAIFGETNFLDLVNGSSFNNIWAGYFKGRGHFSNEVGIGTTTMTAGYILNVNGSTRTVKEVSGSATNIGLFASARNSTASNYGVQAQALGTAGTSYAVYGEVAHATTTPSNQRYAIYGETRPSQPQQGSTTQGIWAGYFNGRTFSPGQAWTASDKNLKQNLHKHELNNSNILRSVSAYTYDFKRDLNTNLALPDEVQHGFIAQEIEQFFPELVTEVTHPAKYDSLGKKVFDEYKFKAVNQGAMLPILWSIVQDQQKQIDAIMIKGQNVSRAVSEQTQLNRNVGLKQNYPNPWDRETTIEYNLPEDCKRAMIMITDMTGTSLKQIELDLLENKLVIQSGSFRSGTYIYLLIADGIEVDSKKMIVTK